MRGYFDVAPRYSAGSPAAVREEIALQVMKDERAHIRYFLDGTFGEENQQLAQRLGLHGIVVLIRERGGKLVIEDLLDESVMEETTRKRLLVGQRVWLDRRDLGSDVTVVFRHRDEIVVEKGDRRFQLDRYSPSHLWVFTQQPVQQH